jgi:hypothetical protein
MSNVHILSINTIGKCKEISVKRPYKQGLKQLIDKLDIYLLYWWEYDSKKFEVYGSIEQTTFKERNIHRLPKNGLSELLEKSSDEIDLYGTLLIVKYDQNVLVNVTEDEYQEFKDITKICDESDSSDEMNRYGEEISVAIDKELKTEEVWKIDSYEELDIDQNEY